MTFTRRRFLQTLVVSAGALSASTLLTGCMSDDDNIEAPELTKNYFPQSVMSGDPTPDSVILWTRLVDGNDFLKATLQVSTSETDFSNVVYEGELDVSPLTGNCLKVRVTGLTEHTYYYYRFVYVKNGVQHSSKVGRTKTAPLSNADVDVKFAFVSCQDYLGRYYNTYLSILEQDDLDFVLHLGDYIYETDGDSSFQDTTGERQLTFRDSDGALDIGVGPSAYKAAQSVDNYRQLYETYRSDPVLQEVHERFPLISIWDDHEFSDDSWQTNATYNDGAAGEDQLQRKKNSEQVYFEFMPIDHSTLHDGNNSNEQLAVSNAHLYPNTKIYRDLQFGANLHLFLTDYRTNRPDHLIPEDAFPGAMVMDATTISGTLTNLGYSQPQIDATLAGMSPVIDIDDPSHSIRKLILTSALIEAYKADYLSRLILSEEDAKAKAQLQVGTVLQGKLTSSYLNLVLVQAQATLPNSDPLKFYPLFSEDITDDGVEPGLAYYTMGKTSLFADLGARYLVIKPSFDLYAAYMSVANPNGKTAYSTDQFNWLAAGIGGSGAGNKVVASSVSSAPLIADLSPTRQPLADPVADATLNAILSSLAVPDLLKQQFYLNVDHWDGFPVGKQELIQGVYEANGVISLSGDIHSSFVTEHQYLDGSTKSVDFTTSSVSSGTFGSFLSEGLDALLAQLGPIPDGIDALKALFDDIALASSAAPGVKSKLSLAKMGEHGVSIATASSAGFKVEYHNVVAPVTEGQPDFVKTSYYDNKQAYLDNVVKREFNWDGTVLTDLTVT